MPNSLDVRSRAGQVTAALARDLLVRKPGDRLPTIAEYARRFGAGNGSVDKALRVLHENDAVLVEARGHLGSFIVRSNPGVLWTASGGGPIVGALPRPNSIPFEGLLAGLVATFSAAGVPFTPLFVSGGRQRIASLALGRVHFILLSEVAARMGMDHQMERVCTLHPESFYPAQSIVVLSKAELVELEGSERIAIDRGSYDHEVLTLTQFGEREFIDVPYDLIPDRLADGSIDAAVWHRASRGTMADAYRWRMHQIATPETQAMLRSMTCATVLIRRDDAATRAILSATIDPRLIESCQAEVRQGRYAPRW